MAIKYEIHTMKNVAGTGQDRKFVRIHRNEPLDEDEMETAIEHSCTATRADVRGVLAALGELARRELAEGNRFHIPGIGWFGVTASLSKEAQEPGHKITGKDIYPSGIQFQPEEDFYNKVTEGMQFKQSPFTTRSKVYDEETLWQLLDEHLDQHGYITRSEFCQLAGLAKGTGIKWLNVFLEKGMLRQGGTRHQILYFRK